MDAEDVVRAGPLKVSPRVGCVALLFGEPLPLGVCQVRVLGALVSARGRVLSREDLYERSRQRPAAEGSRAIDQDAWRIRRALGPFGRFLRGVRKVGYALDTAGLEAATRAPAVGADLL